MNIKTFIENEYWIVKSDDPAIVAKGKTELEALQNYTLLYEVEIDFKLQQEIFGY